MSDLLKRRGIVKIQRSMISDEPDGILEVFKDILVVQIDNDFMSDILSCKGYCKYFDLIEDNGMVPNYIAEIHKNYNGNHEVEKIDVTWHREKEYTEKSVKDLMEEIKREIVRVKA